MKRRVKPYRLDAGATTVCINYGKSGVPSVFRLFRRAECNGGGSNTIFLTSLLDSGEGIRPTERWKDERSDE